MLLLFCHLHFRQGETLAWILMQHPRYQVPEILTNYRFLTEHHWVILDFAVQSHHIIIMERDLSIHEGI